MRMRSDHRLEDACCRCEIGGAEKHPGEADACVGDQAGKNPCGEGFGPCAVLARNAHQPLEDQIKAVDKTPCHEGPRCSMPQAAEKHHDHEVGRGANGTDTVSSQRNIKIVAKKSGKRDMPAPPEI